MDVNQEYNEGIYRLKPSDEADKAGYWEVWVKHSLYGWYRHPGNNDEDYIAAPGHKMAELRTHLVLFAMQRNLSAPPSGLVA